MIEIRVMGLILHSTGTVSIEAMVMGVLEVKRD